MEWIWLTSRSSRADKGGNIFVGANAKDNTPVNSEGILTLQGGSILTYTDQSVIVDQSRIFTEQGGNIDLFSANWDQLIGSIPTRARLSTRMTGPLDPANPAFMPLLAAGIDKAAQKLGEEAIETVIAAVQGDKKALVSESADLMYHWLVVLGIAGVPLSDVLKELQSRTGRSGVAEKASRSQG